MGLRRQRVSGICGVALMPDMTLSQALPLAETVRYVVVPCHMHQTMVPQHHVAFLAITVHWRGVFHNIVQFTEVGI